MLTASDLEKIYTLLSRPSLMIAANEVMDYVALKQNIAAAYDEALRRQSEVNQQMATPEVAPPPEANMAADPAPLAPPAPPAPLKLPSTRKARKTARKR